MRYTKDFTDMNDIYHGLIKAAVFGFALAVISCMYGFVTRGGARGVGKSTTRAVVVSSMAILILDYIITSILRAFDI
jgi:phospholipid/cholesterol/gamma-HCH transport system permease protein